MKNYCILWLFGLFASLQGQEFVVGTTSGYAPYVSLDESGQYVGFDIDIAQLLAKKLNRELRIVDLGSMPSLFIGLNAGKIDAIIWAISITEERSKQVAMIYYQGQKVTKLPMLFWQKIPENVKSPQDLANDPKNVVCVEAGSFQESVLKKVEGLKLKQVDKVMDAILELRYNKAIATMVDPALVGIYQKQFPQLTVLEVALEPSQQSLGNGICIAKSNPRLIADVQRAVSELELEGQIALLEKKWNLEGK